MMTCLIEGCGKPRKAHGWCGAHYYRWREHGDPLGGRTPEGEPLKFFLDVVLTHDKSECLAWPYAVDGHGYGRIWVDGKLEAVHRLICEHENGLPPSPDFEAAHSCGNGHLGCVSPKHLSWKTRTENKADELIHGTRNRGKRNGFSKLSEHQASVIKAASSVSADELADMFSVSKATIYSIRRGENWGWLHV